MMPSTPRSRSCSSRVMWASVSIAVLKCHPDLERHERVFGCLAGPTAVGERDRTGVIEEGVHSSRSSVVDLVGRTLR